MALSCPARVLALRALGLGDVLTAVPAFKALQRTVDGRWRGARLVVAMPRAYAPLLELAGVDADVTDASGLDARLPGCDLAVNLHGSGPQSHRLLAASIAPAGHMTAFANEEAGVDGPAWRDDEHDRVRWCRLLGEGLDIEADSDDTRLAAPHGPDGGGAIVVHPGAASGSRRWPAERWAEVVRWATAHGHRVVVTGTVAERPLAARVAELSGRPDLVEIAAGTTDVRALAGLVAHAAAVVAGDTGVGHLAAAYPTPSVHLMGPVAPDRWGPAPGDHRVVLWHGTTGDPHGDVPDPGLLKIAPDDVIEALVGVPAR